MNKTIPFREWLRSHTHTHKNGQLLTNIIRLYIFFILDNNNIKIECNDDGEI